MFAGPVFLRSAEVAEALVVEVAKTNLFQVRKIDPPATPKVSIEPVGKEILQNLFCVILRCKLQRRINRIVPEWQIQNLENRVAELVVCEPSGAGLD